jgi:hypothetical protein
MTRDRKKVQLWDAGELRTIGDVADWEEVAIVVDVYLDKGGYDPAWHLDPTTSVEAKDHYACTLTTDA